MNEHESASPEIAREAIDTSVEREKNLNRLREEAERSPEFDKHSVEKLKQRAEQEAVSGKEYSVGESGESGRPQTMTRQLKQETYKKTLQRVRRHLSPAEKSFSHFIHQPTIEKVSNAGSQTVGRSSGLLGGAIFAFAGSLGLVILSKRVGFTYNYLIFLLLFIVGFVIGLVIEALVKLLVRPAKH